MDKYTFKNTPLKDAFKKASQQSPYVKNLVQEAKQKGIARRYTTKDSLNAMARECVRKDTERHAKPKPVTIKDDIHTRDGITYNLNPSQADYESMKLMAKERMLTYISDFVASRETYIYNSTEKYKPSCWKEFYLNYTHEINAYQQSYRLAKMLIDTALAYTDNPLFDYTMKNVKRDVWDLLVLDCGNEHDAIVTGWIITKIIHKAVQQNGIEFREHRIKYTRETLGWEPCI